jgi:hypothetical protein
VLPFLKSNKNKMITTLMDQRQNGHRVSVSPVIESKDHPDHDEDLESACVKILAAFEHKHVQDLRDALKEAFQCMDAEPHVEGEHIDAPNQE